MSTLTNEQAAQNLERLIDDSGLYGNPTLTEDAINSLFMGARELRRNDVKKWEKTDDIFYNCSGYKCPKCHSNKSFHTIEIKSNGLAYCPNCGQRLEY